MRERKNVVLFAMFDMSLKSYKQYLVIFLKFFRINLVV